MKGSLEEGEKFKDKDDGPQPLLSTVEASRAVLVAVGVALAGVLMGSGLPLCCFFACLGAYIVFKQTYSKKSEGFILMIGAIGCCSSALIFNLLRCTSFVRFHEYLILLSVWAGCCALTLLGTAAKKHFEQSLVWKIVRPRNAFFIGCVSCALLGYVAICNFETSVRCPSFLHVDDTVWVHIHIAENEYVEQYNRVSTATSLMNKIMEKHAVRVDSIENIDLTTQFGTKIPRDDIVYPNTNSTAVRARVFSPAPHIAPSFWAQLLRSEDDPTQRSKAVAFQVTPSILNIDGLKKAVMETAKLTGPHFTLKVYAHDAATGKWVEVMEPWAPLAANTGKTAYHVHEE